MSSQRIHILLDPVHDAWSVGLCVCERCVRRYIRSYSAAARRVVRQWVRAGWLPEGTEVEVRLGKYGCDPTPKDEPPGLWQAIHDACQWKPLRGHQGAIA